MNHYLINPNQVRSFNIPVHDNNFYTTVFGIDADEALTPLTSEDIVISFESQVPTAWEGQNLSVIFLTGDQWDSMNAELGIRTRDQSELRTIKYLTSCMKQR